MPWREVNFDGLIGPSHNYSGLAFGNIASASNQGIRSNPKQAALQGLQKMRWMMDRGFMQAVLPPQLRPNFKVFKQLGFGGDAPNLLRDVWKQTPDIFRMGCSASSMWVANAATVAPSCDTVSGKLIITPANLVSQFHRSIEAEATQALMRYVFSDQTYFKVNDALPSVSAFSDEGAANHMRIVFEQTKPALHVFVYGRHACRSNRNIAVPTRFPARQTTNASRAVSRLNNIDKAYRIFVQQSPQAIDAGVFHNDVIALSHDNLLVCHEKAFLNQRDFLQQLNRVSNGNIEIIEVLEKEIALDDAVQTYLFNSQIVTDEHGARIMLLPIECQINSTVRHYVEDKLKSTLGLKEISYLDLQQSMKNGGGPACLRLRINMNEQEIKAMQGDLMLDDSRYRQLVDLVQAQYPEEMEIESLEDWGVSLQLLGVVKEIYTILGLPESLLQPYLP